MILSNKPRGTQDISPPRSLIYQKIQQIAIEILHKNNYQPLIFPTFEAKELFTSSLGSATDIIHKEMYTFLDRKGREMSLRPEGTASVVRLVCQNKLVHEGYSLKFYYWANMFRYERPQKGRYREFWQLGVELINADGVYADYQILKLVHDILKALGINDFIFNLNYLGDNETKERYKNKLENFIEKNNLKLCEICQIRYKTNSLRIIDCFLCKNQFSYPFYKDAWSDQDNKYINKLILILNKFNFPYKYDYCLVRGLDYYTGLVFEVSLGKEKALLGGGRYDNLYQRVGGKDTPAIGFAIGIERLVDCLENSKLLKVDNKVDIYFFVSLSETYLDVLNWKKKLENYPFIIDYNLEVKKEKSISKVINYYQPRILVILRKKELKNKKIFIKDCQKNKTFLVNKNELVKWISEYLCQE